MKIKDKHLIRAAIWYNDHKNSILNNIDSETKFYPPTDSYDVVNPRVWKPEHWKWFIGKYL